MKLIFLETNENKCSHHPVTFNNNHISKDPHQKHLAIVLDSKLDL